MQKKLTSLIVLVLCLVMVFTASAFSVQAEETEEVDTAAVVAELTELCGQLPDADNVTAEDGEIIIKAKKLHDALDMNARAELGTDNLKKVADAYTAYTPFMLNQVVQDIKELPKNVKEKDKDKVVDIYERFSMLSDESKEAMNADRVKQLEKAVKKVAPELLGDDAAAEEEGKKDEKDENTKKTSSSTILGMAIWEFICIAVLALIVIANIVLIVVALTKIKYYNA